MPHPASLSVAASFRRLVCLPARLVLAAVFLPAATASAQTVIPAATGAPATGNFNASTAGSYILNAGNTRSVTSTATEVISIGAATGTFTLQINGTVSQTATGRGIRTSAAGTPTFNLTIGSTGLVKAVSDDAFQARVGTVNFTNLGTLYSGPNLAVTPTGALITGRGLNLRDAAGGTVVNGSVSNSTALIQADGGDAVRVGPNVAFTNYGVIRANGVVNDNSANNVFNSPPNNSVAQTFSAGGGFSFEDPSGSVGATNSSLDNYGSISGARHGVQSGVLGSNLTVTNYATGSIIGRNGSGVGFDSTEADQTRITVNNYGLIRGDYAGVGHVIDRTGSASFTHDGDGDGVDIDGAATITNHSGAQILATGAGGFDTNGRANNSEGISIGGGTITNDGIIRGADFGIVVNNDSVLSRSGVVKTTVLNNAGATIEGQNGFAIRLENKLGTSADDDTITNAGTITGNGSIPNPAGTTLRQDGLFDPNSTGTLDGVSYTGTGSTRFIRGDGSAIQMGEGNDTLTNTGTITGNTGRAINMEGGNDTVNFNGGTITGSINGGAGTDTLALGAGVSHSAGILNFENINVATGTGTLSGVVSGTALTKGGGGTLVLSGANTYTGGTTVSAGTLRVNNSTGSGTGSGSLVLDSGAILAGGGSVAGSVTADGLIAPGNSIGLLTVGGNVTWDGTLANAWQFELGSGNTSDLLAIGGDFLKGTGANFTFDFLNSAAPGTFILIDWAGSTTFSASDFSYTDLGGGLSGSFSFNGSQLEFTAVSAIPEPSTWAAILGVGALGLALWRRRPVAS